ncbi:hypothetical protein CBR_g76276 [Chara braunii]|uniref:Strictosidine synthase conserved region domain-containing protein n=1 Tax=Chara braunii TaxID=69332 RepID=A0A388JJV4_CHABU|nr:hypothetical protein CBR_g76276 [Chara braunii]|eukprot:GBG42794.1 hypothetical protein CBR_g76276 [Chara braunii]
MAVFSLTFIIVVAVSMLHVIWVAATASSSSSPPRALSPQSPPSPSSRRVKRGDAYSAGDGRPSLGFERGKLLREGALFGNLRILNTTFLSGSSELIAENAMLPKPPTNEQHVWAMALSPPPDDSLFFIMSDHIYKLPLDVGPGRKIVTAIAGPWISAANTSVAIGMAIEDPDLAGSGSPQSGNSNSSRGSILHVSDCSNFTLRALAMDGTELFSRNYRGVLFGDQSELSGPYVPYCFRTLAVDNARRVLYAASFYAIYRMNLTSDTLKLSAGRALDWAAA